MHAYTNDQYVSPSKKKRGNSSRQSRNATYICILLHLQHSHIEIWFEKPHCCFDHVRCHVIHALLGKTGITIILLPLEPSFLPLPLLQQACPAASGVEPAQTGL